MTLLTYFDKSWKCFFFCDKLGYLIGSNWVYLLQAVPVSCHAELNTVIIGNNVWYSLEALFVRGTVYVQMAV